MSEENKNAKIPCTKYNYNCECENCVLERKQTGEWWLTEEGMMALTAAVIVAAKGKRHAYYE